MTVFLCQQTFLNNMTELMDILLQGLSCKWLIKPCLHSRVLLLVKFIAPDTSFKQWQSVSFCLHSSRLLKI